MSTNGEKSRNREPVPCEADEHVFRPEVYDAADGDDWIKDECCTNCGWSWSEIADHDRGDCCCPAHRREEPHPYARRR